MYHLENWLQPQLTNPMDDLNWQRLENEAQPMEPEQIVEIVGSSLDSSMPEPNGTLTPAKDEDLLAMTENLRGLNQDLLTKVSQLEQALSECQETLASQKQRSQAQDSLLAQQTKEINVASEQMGRLISEIELSHQVAQRQQILIETLTEQLENSQERVAQLERDCALTQQRYNEQTYQLLQNENNTRQLRDRLLRQQRHTLQFKVALEKCLQIPPLKYDAETEISPCCFSQIDIKTIADPQSIIPKAPPIQPWSTQDEKEQINSSIPTSLIAAISNSSSQETSTLPESIQEQEDSQLEANNEVSNNSSLVISDFASEEDSNVNQPIETSSIKVEATVSSISDSNHISQNQDSNHTTTETEPELTPQIPYYTHLSATHTPVVEVEIKETERSLLNVPASQPLQAEVQNFSVESATQPINESQDTIPAIELQKETVTVNKVEEPVVKIDSVDSKNINESLPPNPKNSIKSEPAQPIIPPSNWPSPVISTPNSSKKRKSPASIELPKLPPINHQQPAV